MNDAIFGDCSARRGRLPGKVIHHIAVILAHRNGLSAQVSTSVGDTLDHRGHWGPWGAGKGDELETISGGLPKFCSPGVREWYLYVEEVLDICSFFYIFSNIVSFPFIWCRSLCGIKFNMWPYKVF